MPTSVRGIKKGHGFTLIEILIVMVIMAIMLALVAAKIGPDDKQALREEAKRIALLLEHTRDEALASGHSMAWGADGSHYRFYQYTRPDWAPLANDDVLRERDFHALVTLTDLEINYQKAKLDDLIVFTPSGMNLPFRVVLDYKGERISVDGNHLGKISLNAINP
ncbi:MAG: GspH/FimT family pseudopilin [Burkholderiales bacterium]